MVKNSKKKLKKKLKLEFNFVFVNWSWWQKQSLQKMCWKKYFSKSILKKENIKFDVLNLLDIAIIEYKKNCQINLQKCNLEKVPKKTILVLSTS